MPLVDILSVDRFSTYQLWANGNDPLAERLYSYNVQLSSELYSSLHMLEVALRNKIDQALIGAHGAGWMHNNAVLIDTYQRRCVANAHASLLAERKAATHAQMVAELNFGFWGSFFGKDSTHLWGTLRPIFQVGGLQRKTVAFKLRDLRKLRNRVAHYEPVLALPLTVLHQDLVSISGWLSADAAAWIAAHSNWPTIHPGLPIIALDPAVGHSTFNTAVMAHLPA